MLSDRAKAISPSIIFEIVSGVKEMQRQGKKVLRFDIGEPDFNTPENIRKAAKKAIDENFSKYTPAAGMPELRQAVAEKFRKDNKINCSADETIVCTGAKQALFNATQVLLNPGDEVILAVPYWITYLELIHFAQAKPVLVQTNERFKLTAEKIEKAVTDKTKLIILNSPSNPSGAVVERKELQKIAELAVEKNIFVISDEVYEPLIYDGVKHESIASFNEEIKNLTITVNGASKTYAMPGWRIGYATANKELIQAMTALQSHATSNPCSIAQKACFEALTGPQQSVKEMLKAFTERRNLTVKRLNELHGISCLKPEGAFYAFPNVSELFNNKIKDSMDLARHFLEKTLVSVVPGIASGMNEHIRVTYASSLEDINEGMNRLEKELKNWSGRI